MLEVEKLSLFSKNIYALIKESFPEWLGLAKESEHEERAFEIRVSSPVGKILEICTCNDEITVSYGYYHSHFDKWSNSLGNIYEEAQAVISELIAGKLLIASVFENNKLIYSTAVNLSDIEQYKAKFKGSLRNFKILGWNCEA